MNTNSANSHKRLHCIDGTILGKSATSGSDALTLNTSQAQARLDDRAVAHAKNSPKKFIWFLIIRLRFREDSTESLHMILTCYMLTLLHCG
jgi:hypothetical protein